VTRVPHSCACGGTHAFGTRCPLALVRDARRRGTTAERMGPGWQTISRRVIERDRGECQLRRPGCTGRATTADHVVARATARLQGWTTAQVNDPSNLVAACRSCNSSKGASR
jgi:5-methylcytosine-specific restriction endonuclease McrA